MFPHKRSTHQKLTRSTLALKLSVSPPYHPLGDCHKQANIKNRSWNFIWGDQDASKMQPRTMTEISKIMLFGSLLVPISYSQELLFYWFWWLVGYAVFTHQILFLDFYILKGNRKEMGHHYQIDTQVTRDHLLPWTCPTGTESYRKIPSSFRFPFKPAFHNLSIIYRIKSLPYNLVGRMIKN